jgi:hypothetical protein
MKGGTTDDCSSAGGAEMENDDDSSRHFQLQEMETMLRKLDLADIFEEIMPSLNGDAIEILKEKLKKNLKKTKANQELANADGEVFERGRLDYVSTAAKRSVPRPDTISESPTELPRRLRDIDADNETPGRTIIKVTMDYFLLLVESHGGGSQEPCPICMDDKTYSTGNRGGLLQHIMRVHPTEPMEFRAQPKNRVRKKNKRAAQKRPPPPSSAETLDEGDNFPTFAEDDDGNSAGGVVETRLVASRDRKGVDVGGPNRKKGRRGPTPLDTAIQDGAMGLINECAVADPIDMEEYF